MHSQLVDGVLRDDRVGGEVGDHVGATEAAGAGGRRLPFAGQRAQGHGSGSRSSGPHPGPRRARVRGSRLGLRGTEGAGSAGSRRPNWARRVAKAAAAAQGLGCEVPGRAPPPARPNPRPGRGAATEWAGRAQRVGLADAPPRSSWHPPGPAACVRTWGQGWAPRRRGVGEGVKRTEGEQERLAFLGNVSKDSSCLLTRSIH